MNRLAAPWYTGPMVNITSNNGRVRIVADSGSKVRNVTVDSDRIVSGPNWWEVTCRLFVYGSLLAFSAAFWFAMYMLFVGIAHASPTSCESIKSADHRHFCQAVTIPKPSECTLIKEHDLRFECQARAGGIK